MTHIRKGALQGVALQDSAVVGRPMECQYADLHLISFGVRVVLFVS